MNLSVLTPGGKISYCEIKVRIRLSKEYNISGNQQLHGSKYYYLTTIIIRLWNKTTNAQRCDTFYQILIMNYMFRSLLRLASVCFTRIPIKYDVGLLRQCKYSLMRGYGTYKVHNSAFRNRTSCRDFLDYSKI